MKVSRLPKSLLAAGLVSCLMPAALPADPAAPDQFHQYVSPDGDDENDGYTAEHPRKSIQAALATLAQMTESGHCTVHLAAGEYPQATADSTIVLDKSITLVGEGNTPGDVVISRTYNGWLRLVDMDHPEAVLSGVTVSGGRTLQQEYGANVRINSNGGTVTNCILTGGYVDNYHGRGANLYMNSSAALATHCVITHGHINSTGGGGKGAAVHIANGRLEHSLVAENYETAGGTSASIVAGVYLNQGSVVNCTIANNESSSCGGIYVNSANATVKNCVIAGNTSTIFGGNSIAYTLSSNASDNSFVNCVTDTQSPINATCLTGTAAALLSNMGSGDYSLAAGSPAIDAGAALATYPAKDLAGNARVQGAAIDIGAYESDPNQLAASFEASVTEAILPATITFTASVTGVAAGEGVSYGWDFDGDGVVDLTSQSPTVSTTYETGGKKTVVLTVTTGSGTVTVTKADYLQLAPRTLYVDLASENPTVPYASWETAAKMPAEAVAAAVDDCEIVVRGALYSLPAKLVVDKGVRLHAESNSAEEVVFKAGYFTVIEVNHANAQVDGIALTDANGNAMPGGVHFGAAGGMVSNCVIRNCRSYSWNGSGGAASIGGPGILTHSIISNCTATTYNNGTKYVLNISQGRLENGLVIDCYSSGGLDASGRNDDCAALVFVGATAVVRNNTFIRSTIHSRGLLNVTAGATVANNVFVESTYAKTSGDTVDGSTAVGFNFGSSASVAGVPAFVNCATDLADQINESCIVGTAATFFKDYANGDYTPNSAGPNPKELLYNAGVTPENAPAVDLAGNPRVRGRAIDIGCLEARPSGFGIRVR